MNSKRLKIVFLTMDEPFYIPKYIDDTLTKLNDKHDVLKIYALPSNLPDMNFIQTVHHFMTYFGTGVFFYMVLLRFLYMFRDLISDCFKINGKVHSVKLVCRKFRVDYSKIDKINSEAALDELRKLDPDIIFSLSCPQILSKQLISIPSRGCLNIHSSMLPLYRGLNANFWVLAKGEDTTGVSIHYVNPGIDDGDILLQEQIQIGKKWSLHDLYNKAMDIGSSMIATCLNSIAEGTATTRPNDISKGSYFSYPTNENTKEFRSRGRTFFKYL